MSIFSQVEDAQYLRHAGRHLGALTTLILAVAASARRVFPDGTQSIDTPLDRKGKPIKMTDRESFERFLGGRFQRIITSTVAKTDAMQMRRIVHIPPEGHFPAYSLQSLPYDGKHHSVEHIIYKFYRCALVHEGQLQEDIVFVADAREATGGIGFGGIPHPANRYITSGGYSVMLGVDGRENRIVMTYGLIDLVLQAVTEADINRDIFGLHALELLPIDDSFDEQAFIQDLYTMSIPGAISSNSFFNKMMIILKDINPANINGKTDEYVREVFSKECRGNLKYGGLFGGLQNDKLLDKGDQLTDIGILVLRRLSEKYIMK